MREVSYPVVRAYVAARAPQIRVEQGRGPVEVFVPQTHLPGREAEVDFGEIAVRLRGQLVTCHLFAFRLSYSGKAVHRASATGGQEAFFEGHVHAFTRLGGVPAGKVRYDNLKAAVAQVIGFSRQRVETDRWIAFRSHFDLDAFYCQPGLTGAHEKGGVEGEIGRFRRNHLVPVPEVDTIAELNELIDGYDDADDHRRIGARVHTVGEAFATEQPLLKPLPVEPCETGRWLTPRVDRYAQITVRSNRYSVPSRLIGRPVRVMLNASDLDVYEARTVVAHHERLLGKGETRLDLDHYLEALIRKPGALPGATALDQARALLDNVAELALPPVAELAPTLSGAQIEHLQRKFAKNTAEFRRDHLQGTAASRESLRIKRSVDRSEMFYGRLDEAQLAVIRQVVVESPFDPQLSLKERERRQRDLTEVLTQLSSARASTATSQHALRLLLQRVWESPDPAARAYAQRSVAQACQALARIHASTTTAQRANAVKVLKGYEADLRALAAAR